MSSVVLQKHAVSKCKKTLEVRLDGKKKGQSITQLLSKVKIAGY